MNWMPPISATDLSKKFRDGLMAIAEKYDVIWQGAGCRPRTDDWRVLQVHEGQRASQGSARLFGAVDKGTFGAAVNVDIIPTQYRGADSWPGLNAIKIFAVNLKEDVNYFLASFEETIANMYTRTGGPAVSLGRAAVKDAVKTVRSKVPGKSLTGKKPQPAGMTEALEYSDYGGPISDECDYLIIGSGPGGIAAERLSRTGAKVIVVDAGPVVRKEHTKVDAGYTLSKYFFYGGMRAARGNSVLAHNAASRNLGGGSVWNSAICLRPPQWVADSGNKSMD